MKLAVSNLPGGKQAALTVGPGAGNVGVPHGTDTERMVTPSSDLVAIVLMKVVCDEIEFEIPGFKEQLRLRLDGLADRQAEEAEDGNENDRVWNQRMSKAYATLRDSLFPSQG